MQLGDAVNHIHNVRFQLSDIWVIKCLFIQISLLLLYKSNWLHVVATFLDT